MNDTIPARYKGFPRPSEPTHTAPDALVCSYCHQKMGSLYSQGSVKKACFWCFADKREEEESNAKN